MAAPAAIDFSTSKKTKTGGAASQPVPVIDFGPKGTGPQTARKEGLGTTALKATGGFGKEILRSTVESAARAGTAVSTLFDAVTPGTPSITEKELKGFEVPLVGHVSNAYSENITEASGQVLSDAIALGTLAEAPIKGLVSKGSKTLLGTAVREGAISSAKNLAKEGLKTTVRRTALDFGLGAGFGVAGELQRDDPTVAHGAEEAIKAGTVAALIPHVLGYGIRGTSAAFGLAARNVSETVDKTITSLEHYAKPASATGERLAVDDYLPSFNGRTAAQEQAHALAEKLKKAKKVPSLLRYHIDRFQGVADDIGGEEGLQAKNAIRIAETKGLGIAKQRQLELTGKGGLVETHGDVFDRGQQLGQLNSIIERAERGLPVQDGKGLEELYGMRDQLTGSLSEPQLRRAQEVADVFHRRAAERLQYSVDAGLISAEAAERMRTANKNYLPHNIEDFYDPERRRFNPYGSGKSLNPAKSEIFKATGSTRKLTGLFEADAQRERATYQAGERNKGKNDVVKAGMAANPQAYIDLVSAENKAARQAIYKDLHPVIAERLRLEDDLGELNDIARKVERGERLAQKEIDTLAGRRSLIDDAVGYGTEAAGGIPAETPGFKKTTGIDAYDVLIPGTKEAEEILDNGQKRIDYYREAKGMEGRMEMMTPDEYINRAASGMKTTSEKLRSSRGVSKSSVGKRVTEYSEKMKAGEEFGLPHLDYSSGEFGQEGLHRALAAEQAGVKEMPVLIIDKPGSSVGKTQFNEGLNQKKSKVLVQPAVIAPNAEIKSIMSKVATQERKLAALDIKGTLNEEQAQMRLSLIDEMKDKAKQLREHLADYREEKIKTIDLPEGSDIINRLVNGTKVTSLVPEDTARAIKYLDSEAVKATEHWFFRLAQAPAKLVRAVTVGLNPVFSLKNVARDTQERIVTQAGVGGVNPIEFAKSMYEAINPKTTTAELVEQMGERISEGTRATISEAEGKYGVKTLYDLAAVSQAFEGTMAAEGVDANKLTRELLEKDVNPLWGFIKNTNPAEMVRKLAQKTEEMSRLDSFKLGLSRGMGLDEAAIFARDATVDFQKFGPALQAANKYIPFLNAHVQGFVNLAKTIKDRPEMAARALMWSAALPTAGLYAWNSRFKSYAQVSDAMKRQYWIIMLSEEKGTDKAGKPTTFPVFGVIPKGQAQMAVSDAVQHALDVGVKKHPESAAKFLGKLINDISPVQTGDNAFVANLPSGLKEGVELAANYDALRDTSIEKDSIFTPLGFKKKEDLNPEDRFTEYTPDLAVAMGQATGWSPLKIKMLMDGLGILNIPSMVFEKNGPKAGAGVTATQTPLVNQLIKTSGGAEDAAEKEYQRDKARAANSKAMDALLKKKK